MRPASGDGRQPPVLLLHGATFAAAVFDLPRPGYSLMGALAGAGRAVYALDVRGYGTSVGGVMDEPPGAHPPFAGVDAVVEDIVAAVSLICRRSAMPAVDLVGFSWGAIAAARYAGGRPQTVRRLALYAPLFAERNASWLDRIADAHDRSRLGPAFGAYRLVTAASVIERWNNDLPGGDPGLFREDGVAELCSIHSRRLIRAQGSRRRARSVVQRRARRPGPGVQRAAALRSRKVDDAGAADTGRARYHVDGDRSATPARGIASPVKRYRVISPGSHFLCIERNRARLYHELNDFLAPDLRPPSWPPSCGASQWPGTKGNLS